MISASDRQRILVKLINACHDLEDALSQSSSRSRQRFTLRVRRQDDSYHSQNHGVNNNPAPT